MVDQKSYKLNTGYIQRFAKKWKIDNLSTESKLIAQIWIWKDTWTRAKKKWLAWVIVIKKMVEYWMDKKALIANGWRW